MTIIATLPSALLWAASFASSSDGSKGTLCSIDIRQEGSNIRIASIDGHRGFRCYLPSSDHFYAPAEPLRVAPRAFSKAPSRKTLVAEIDDGGQVLFKDKLNQPSGAAVWTPDPWALSETPFPNIDQVWPSKDQLPSNPGAFISMNASYVADFAKIAAKISQGPHMRLYSADSPHAPILWESLLCNSWLDDSDALDEREILLEYLLMPVTARRN